MKNNLSSFLQLEKKKKKALVESTGQAPASGPVYKGSLFPLPGKLLFPQRAKWLASSCFLGFHSSFILDKVILINYLKCNPPTYLFPFPVFSPSNYHNLTSYTLFTLCLPQQCKLHCKAGIFACCVPTIFPEYYENKPIFFFLAAPGSMRDLNSPTRDRTRTLCSGSV